MTAKNDGAGTKDDWTLLLDDFRQAMGLVLAQRQHGVQRYSRFNWRESAGTDDEARFLAENRQSILRHAVDGGDDLLDLDESGQPHAAAIALRALIALEHYAAPLVAEQVISEPHKGVAPAVDSTSTGATLYPWDKAPEWAQWAAMDANGGAYWYSMHPVGHDEMYWYRCDGRARPIDSAPVDTEWRDSLERRPNFNNNNRRQHD